MDVLVLQKRERDICLHDGGLDAIDHAKERRNMLAILEGPVDVEKQLREHFVERLLGAKFRFEPDFARLNIYQVSLNLLKVQCLDVFRLHIFFGRGFLQLFEQAHKGSFSPYVVQSIHKKSVASNALIKSEALVRLILQ